MATTAVRTPTRSGILQPPAAVLARIGDRVPFFLAAIVLGASLALPYWHMTLLAPQYPGGLRVVIYLTKLAGDIQ